VGDIKLRTFLYQAWSVAKGREDGCSIGEVRHARSAAVPRTWQGSWHGRRLVFFRYSGTGKEGHLPQSRDVGLSPRLGPKRMEVFSLLKYKSK